MAVSFLEAVSLLFGWVYTFCWSLSFYPQPILNFRRKSTTGTTIDFPAINVLGFAAYFVSNVAFLYSPQIRREYAARHHGLTPTVALNDIYFSGHAVIICTIIVTQFIPSLWGFEKRSRKSAGARISKPIWGVQIGSIVGVLVVVLIVAIRHDKNPATGWAWIDVVCQFLLLFLFENTFLTPILIDLCCVIREATHHACQIYAPTGDELQ